MPRQYVIAYHEVDQPDGIVYPGQIVWYRSLIDLEIVEFHPGYPWIYIDMP